MSFYNTDLVNLLVVTMDAVNGTKTTAAPVSVKCRLEDTNELIRNSKGEMVKANSLIMWPENVAIKIGDQIVPTSIMSASVTENKTYDVKKTFRAGGFSMSHIEVYI